MYDVANSTYVSLADIAEMIRSGEQVRVISKNGETDYTAKVLQQIILDQNKESGRASLSTLHEWIRMGGSFLDQQLDDFKSGMESWIQERTTSLFKGLNREEFSALQNKVSELEKKVEELDE